jgi:hypothetical protein
MSGCGTPGGSHRSSSVVCSHSLSESADQNLTPNAEQMNTQGSSVAAEYAKPQEGSAPLINWPEEGKIEDAVPIEVPAVPCSQPVEEKSNTFAATNQGESQNTAAARLSNLLAVRARLMKILMLIMDLH